jgi:hypothetical protein
VRFTERDRRLLEFAADHRFVQPEHVQALLGISGAAAVARLRALCGAGVLIRERWFHRDPASYRIAKGGLSLIGSELPPPRVDLRAYEHDIGVAWLWLHARRGTFGPLREVLAERQLRSRDAAGLGAKAGPAPAWAQDAMGEPFGVRLGGVGPGGRERLHYPDLLLTTSDGRRIALELELSAKGRTRRERILAGYGADRRIDGVVYLVENPAVGRSVSASARRLGIDDRVQVQLVRLSRPGVGGAASLEAERGRSSGAEARRAESREPEVAR